ncbi:PorT family protein [Flavobacterium sp. J49]|uniref:porin family protein n=1 Tax=Flavobacterium sp. J49 TaxID=2718534 RepID=UPI001594ADE6|nr:porin family protein [Flavobacterium sp. J49]MBF6642305.1 PorT family protein [Flavobacterium sp. J49]NIC03551.1 PorT family protein [Flavobacterium sp. J49]
MKRVIMVIAMITLSTTGALAQTDEKTGTDNRSEISVGIKGGVNLSNVYDSEGDDFVADSKVGFVLGGFVSIPLGRYFGLQPEVLFSQKGFKSSGTFLGSTYEMTRTSNYIDVPLLVSFRPVESVSILFGPQFSYLTKQKDDFEGGTISATQEEEFSNANLRKNTFGLTGGVDFNVDRMVIGLRAGWDVKNNNGDGTSDTPRYKNMWYQATIGYRF